MVCHDAPLLPSKASSSPHYQWHRTPIFNGSCIGQIKNLDMVLSTRCLQHLSHKVPILKLIAVFPRGQSHGGTQVREGCGIGKEGGVGRGGHQRCNALRPLRHRVPGAIFASACPTAAAIMEGYEVLEKLGSGSFGTIRRVIRKSDKKVLLLLLSVRASAQARGAKALWGSCFLSLPRFLFGSCGPACWCQASLVPQHQQPAEARLKMAHSVRKKTLALRNMPSHHHHLPPWWCTSTGLAEMS